MFHRDLLSIVRLNPASNEKLEFLEGIEENGHITSGRTLDPATGRTYPVTNGYLDLLGRRIGANNVVNLLNFLPGAGPAYEPLWRVRSRTLLTGESFPTERELESIADLVEVNRGSLYLDLGCSGRPVHEGLAKLRDRRVSNSLLRAACASSVSKPGRR